MKKNLKILILWGFLPSMALFFGPALFLEAWGLLGFETITSFLPKNLVDGFVVSGFVYALFISILLLVIRFALDPNRAKYSIRGALTAFLLIFVGVSIAYMIVIAVFIQAISNFSM